MRGPERPKDRNRYKGLPVQTPRRVLLSLRIEWSEGPHYPDLVKGGAAGVAGGFLVHAGGMTYPWRETEAGWWLDADKEQWLPLPSLPVGRAYTMGASDGDVMYVVGGRRRFRPLNDAYALHRTSRKWRWLELPRLNQPRGVPAVAIGGSRLIAVGGGSWGRGAFLPDDVPGDEMLDLDSPSAGWTGIPKCPGKRRANACAAGVGGFFYVFGGAHAWMDSGQLNVERLRDSWRYDPDGGEWAELPPLPCPGLSGAAALVHRDRYIILVGGGTPGVEGGGDAVVEFEEDSVRGVRVGWYNRKVFAYDVEDNSFETLDTDLPHAAHDIRAALLGETIYALGGENVDPSTSNTCAHLRVGKLLPD